MDEGPLEGIRTGKRSMEVAMNQAINPFSLVPKTATKRQLDFLMPTDAKMEHNYKILVKTF